VQKCEEGTGNSNWNLPLHSRANVDSVNYSTDSAVIHTASADARTHRLATIVKLILSKWKNTPSSPCRAKRHIRHFSLTSRGTRVMDIARTEPKDERGRMQKPAPINRQIHRRAVNYTFKEYLLSKSAVCFSFFGRPSSGTGCASRNM
jgi:hypothetical protein